MSPQTATDRLAATIRGRVLRPDDADYEDARRVWNGMVDRRPALIVRCRGTADVVAAVDHAREHGLEVSVRGGGHGVAGKAVCEGGVMIDLSPMDGVKVDPDARIARVGPGATLGQLDHECQAFGLATTGGVDSRTGVAGLTLGGGVGYLARSCGLAIDNLRAAEVVLADGRIVRASADDHPDLYWGLRGGSGNFGVVTEFEFGLHEVGPEVMTAQVFLTMDEAATGLRAYRDLMAEAADGTAVYALFVNVPPVEPFPAEQHGRTCLALVGLHNGPIDEGERALAPFGEIGEPMLAVVAPMPYTTLQSSFDAGAPDGGRYYWKSGYLDGISDELIDTLVERVDPLPGAYSNAYLEPMGGAVARVDRDATAFPHRDEAFNFGISSGWEDPADDERAIAWTRGLHAAVAEHSTGGIYVNYLDRDDDDRVDAAYRGNLGRLQAIKATYDPDNLFSWNPNIVPRQG